MMLKFILNILTSKKYRSRKGVHFPRGKETNRQSHNMSKPYVMTHEEVEAAVYNWLDSSGSHVTDQFPDLDPLEIIHKGVTIQFEEDTGLIE